MKPNPCECIEDGQCARYGRPMTGRFREICAGLDVDMGTAAAFREQWGREAVARPVEKPISLLLKTDQMPGDTVALTAAIYSLHRAHPGKYLTAVQSLYPDVFSHNPDVVTANSIPDAAAVQMHYPAIHTSIERAIHFMQGWTEFLGAALGVSVPLLTNRPRLYFADNPPFIEDYWVVCSGGKNDFTNKLWGQYNYQTVVNMLHGKIRFIQVGDKKEDHPRLRGTEYMVGNTNLRGLFEVIRRARGVLCGVSLPMHVAAALERPAIVIAGGRESVAWNAYPKQQYVHTVGALPCHSVQGHTGQACWRSRVVPLNDGQWYDDNPCERPAEGLPACMRLINPIEVAALVMRYN